MKNYEQALQDAGEVCQNEPLLPKGHHVKAQALSGLGRSKETLKEFLCCLALNPECNSVKKEAQKLLCEVFFPTSENMPQNLTSSTQSILLNTRLKAPCRSHVNSRGPVEEGGGAAGSENPSEKPDVFRNSSSSVLHFILGLHCEEDQEMLDSILPTESSTGLKRQFPSDSEDAYDVNAPGKIPKKDELSDRKRIYDEEVTELSQISEYGCMLEIKDVRTFPDGSPVVDTVGISCFRVLSHRRRDGYNMADTESLEDERVEGPEHEELDMLHDSVYQQSGSWLDSLQDHMREQILSHFVSMPDREPEPPSYPSGPAWSWWTLAVLPLERKAQLGMISLKEHLLAIQRILVVITHKMNSQQELINSRGRNT